MRLSKAFLRIGIFDPYLDSLGGGERYTLTVAEYLSKNNQIEIFWDGEDLRGEAEKRLPLDLERVRFVSNIFTQERNLLERLLKTNRYDLIFYLSDGSIPSSLAKKNILHFQTPFIHVRGKTILNKLKLSRFKWIICNSYFTKKFIDKTYGVKSIVIYPPVDVAKLAPEKKRNLILTVGRFTSFFENKHSFSSNKQSFSSNKKQEVMIEAFKNLIDQGLSGWEFYLVGGLLESDRNYFKKLENQVSGYPIKLLPNISFSELKKYYGEAKIYWHGKGYGEDEEKNPELFEHFGISCVEAMAAGAVPIVFDGGGLREIIEDGSGLLWQLPEDLQNLTRELIGDEDKLLRLSNGAQKRAKDFSKETFLRRFDEILTK